jgi:hypothetical protein
MSITLKIALAVNFLGLFILVVGYGNRSSKWGLLSMYVGVVMLLSTLAFHIHVILDGGY